MKKKILVGLAAFVGLIVVAGLILPKEMRIEREIVINAPKSEVFDYLKFTKNGLEWSPWEKLDPNVQHEFKGSDGTAGYIITWDGNKEIGKGEQEIKNIVPGERIDMELRFVEPMEGVAQTYFVTEALAADQTKVIWGINSESKFPYNIFCAIMNMGGFMQKQFDQGLVDLKAKIEQ